MTRTPKVSLESSTKRLADIARVRAAWGEGAEELRRIPWSRCEGTAMAGRHKGGRPAPPRAHGPLRARTRSVAKPPPFLVAQARVRNDAVFHRALDALWRLREILSDEGWTFVEVDGLGRVRRVSHAAKMMLARAGGSGHLRRGEALPAPLVRLFRASVTERARGPWSVCLGDSDVGVRVAVIPEPGSVEGYLVLLRPGPLRGVLAALTPREQEIVDWVGCGKTDRQIAAILGLSVRTVQKHLEHAYVKLGVENRTAAALRAGLAVAGLQPSR